MDATVNPEGVSVAWTTDNAEVATVSADGIVTATGVGEATVTASVTVGGVTVTDSIPVTVTDTPTLTLNRYEWWLDPNLEESATHGAAYVEAKLTGALDDAVVRWRIEPLDAPKVLYPKDQDESVHVDPYTDEGIPTPFATPTKIRWNWRPDAFGTDWRALAYPLTQTSVCTVTTGGLTLSAETVIEIRQPDTE